MTTDTGVVKCPYCAEEIKAEAIKCKHCGEWLADKPKAIHSPSPPEPPPLNESIMSAAQPPPLPKSFASGPQPPPLPQAGIIQAASLSPAGVIEKRSISSPSLQSQKIPILRPALNAALLGFMLGLLTPKRPGAPYGDMYLAEKLLLGFVFAVMFFTIIGAWKGFRRYTTKPGKVDPDISSFSILTRIVTNDDAVSAIKMSSWLIIIIAATSFSLRLLVGINWLNMLDEVLFLGLAIIALKLNSRAAAIALLLFSIAGVLATGYNKFYGGAGGANLWAAFPFAWASAVLVRATFKLNQIRENQPLPVVKGVNHISTSLKADQESRICSECGKRYYCNDYQADAPVWRCTECKGPLPKENK